MKENIIETEQTVITSEALLKHWQDHRRISRKVIEAFPENKLFSDSIGGMRPFSELAKEMIKMAGPGIHGVSTVPELPRQHGSIDKSYSSQG